MKTKILISMVAAAYVFVAVPAFADDGDMFDDRYYVSVLGSYAGNQGNPRYKDGFGGGLTFGRVIAPHFGFEVIGRYVKYQGESTSTPATGPLCGLLAPCPNQTTQLPDRSLRAGGIGMNLYASGKDATGVYLHADVGTGNHFTYNLGLGFDQPIFNRAIYLRGEALFHKDSNLGSQPMYNVGVRIPFGAAPKANPSIPQEEVSVVPLDAPALPDQPAAEQAAPTSIDAQPGADAQPAPEVGGAPLENSAPSADQAPAEVVPAAESAPLPEVASEPAPTPAPKKKHVAKRHKKKATAAIVEAPAEQSNVAQPENTSQIASPTQNDSIAPTQSQSTSAPEQSAEPVGDAPVATEPAPAPPGSSK